MQRILLYGDLLLHQGYGSIRPLFDTREFFPQFLPDHLDNYHIATVE